MAIIPRRSHSKPLAIETRQFDAWQCRRDQLVSNLDSNPDGEWAWLWRTRVKVLDYLLERYAGDTIRRHNPNSLAHLKRDTPAQPTDTSHETTAPYDQVPQITQSDPGPESQISHKRKARLASLHSTNENRREIEQFNQLYVRKSVDPKRAEQTRFAGEALYQLLLAAQAIERTTYPDDLYQPTGEPDTDEFIDALAAADAEQTGVGLLRQIIAFDLGMPDLPVELLDEQTIREILAEHGIDPDEIR